MAGKHVGRNRQRMDIANDSEEPRAHTRREHARKQPCMCSKRLGATGLEQRDAARPGRRHSLAALGAHIRASERPVLLRARVRQRARIERSSARATLTMLRIRAPRAPLRTLKTKRGDHNYIPNRFLIASISASTSRPARYTGALFAPMKTEPLFAVNVESEAPSPITV